MDLLGHVNNVTYLDYLQEARIDLFAVYAGFSGVADLAEGVIVVRHEVEFVAPLVFRRGPVLIDVWITDIGAATFTMAYEVYDETESGRRVFLRATSVLVPYVFAGEHPRRIAPEERKVLERFLEPARARASIATAGSARHVYPIKVRFSDVDVFRHVNNVQYFEFFQEARIQYLMTMHTRGQKWNNHVVARADVDYRKAILYRHEPYQVHSWISEVGNRSFTIAAEIRDSDEVLASSQVVMVTFDMEAQASAVMTTDQRTRLLAEMDDVG
jgi:acyl-CoA thioester hydrolase